MNLRIEKVTYGSGRIVYFPQAYYDYHQTGHKIWLNLNKAGFSCLSEAVIYLTDFTNKKLDIQIDKTEIIPFQSQHELYL